MKYIGKLYGKLGNKYFDTEKTSVDWDKLEENANNKLNIIDVYHQFYIDNDEMIKEWSDNKRVVIEFKDWLIKNNYSFQQNVSK